MISGHGPIDAEIMLISDFASKEDVLSERALSGNKERTIRTILNQNKFSIDNIYRTTLIKGELSYYGKAKRKLTEAIKEAESKIQPSSYQSIIIDEILAVSPNIIVPLGDMSLRAITGLSGITKYRGSVLPTSPEIQIKIGQEKTIRVIPTLDPQYIWEDWNNRLYVDLDIKKILSQRLRTDPIDSQGLIWICKTIQAFREFIKRHYANASYLFFDIETYLGIPTAISFCFDGNEAISIPLFTDQISLGDGALLLYEINKLLSSDIPKGNQAIIYDNGILRRFGIYVNNIKADTLIASSLIYPELPRKLHFLTSVYTNVPYYKDDGKDYDPKVHNISKLLFYNAKDALTANQIHIKQQKELEEFNLTSLYKKMIKLIPIYTDINQTGILVNQTYWNELKSRYKVLRDVFHNTIEILTRQKINVNSSQQVGKLVYDTLGFPKRSHSTTTGKSAYSTEEDILEELAVLHGKENKLGADGEKVIWYIIACRKITKLLQFLSFELHPDSRLRTSYNLGGTETGRTSTGRTLDHYLKLVNGVLVKSKRLGVALQTIPRHGFRFGGVHKGIDNLGQEVRKIFIPTPGYAFIEVDQSQAEARVCAVLGEAYEFLKLFDIPPGIHCLTAKWCFGRDIEKGSIEYHIGKTVRHAGERNIQYNHLARMVQLPLDQAVELLDIFHKNSPHIRNVFHKDIRDFVRKKAFLVAPNSRRRDFFGRMDEGTYNEAISQLPQAIVTDQTKFAMLDIWEQLYKNKFKFLYEGHDSILAEVKEDYVDEYCKIAKSAFEREIDFRPCSLSREFDLVIPCEISISDKSWGEMKIYNGK